MKKTSLFVVDPAVKTPELDAYNEIVSLCPQPTSFHLPALFGMDSLKSREPSSILILGSASSVYDKSEWLPPLSEWLLSKIQAGIPTLGICFGHQLLAHLFGAKVGYLFPDKTKFQGFRDVQFKPNSLWKVASGKIFASHREVVMECPKDFDVIASSESVSFDGFSHKKLPLWTLQAHPEATLGFLKNMKYQGPVEDLAFGRDLVSIFLKRT